MNGKIKIALLLLALTSFSSLAFALGNGGNDAAPVLTEHVSLTQAVRIAEKAADGSASRAEYEKTGRGGVYEVEVVGTGGVYDVKVDAGKGTVLSSTPDRHDLGGGDGDEHENGDERERED